LTTLERGDITPLVVMYSRTGREEIDRTARRRTISKFSVLRT